MTSRRPWRRLRWLAILVALGLATGASRAGAAEEAPAIPGRLIVKYRASVDGCVDCLFARRAPLASITGSRSLDALHAALGVRGVRPLFRRRHDAPGRAAWNARVDAIRRRWPARAARAPGGALPADLSRVYVLDIPPTLDPLEAAARYAADPDVEWAEPDHERHTTFTPNDPYFATSGSWGQAYRDLWGLAVTDAATAWNTANGTGIVVAVIDTGIDQTHPDLAANMWTNPGEIPGNGIDDDGNGFIDDVRGWDFVDGDADPYDLVFHGTHCAGTIAAVGNNARGVVGMAWGARIMPVRGLDAHGSGNDSTLAPAILYAAENGADVLSNSWGGYGFSNLEHDAVATARALGVVVIAAAGNNASTTDHFEPADIPGVIAVAAVQPDGSTAGFSNFGDAVSVAAPGVDILSLRAAVVPASDSGVVGTDYFRLSGTSMATPHVAGLSAVLLSALPTLTVDDVRWHLELNADQPGYQGYVGEAWNPHFGWGRINAARVFTPPPVTTRLRPRKIIVHRYAGEVAPAIAVADLAFTTASAVPWSLTAPSWLRPSTTSGAGSATVTFDFDGTGETPGPIAGTVAVSASAAVDGGATIGVTGAVHSDVRAGGATTIATDVLPIEGFRDHALAGDGIGGLATWIGGQMRASRIDGGGTVGPPAVLPLSTPAVPRLDEAYDIDVASDGRDFLVVWAQLTVGANVWTSAVMAARVGSDGAALDTRPIVVVRRDLSPLVYVRRPHVAFDGSAYVVVWEEFDADVRIRGRGVSFRRVGRDGSVGPHVRTIRGSNVEEGGTDPRVACLAGSCLVAWQDGPAGVAWFGKYSPAHVVGVRIAGDKPLDRVPLRLVDDIDRLADLRVGDGYGILGWRQSFCGSQTPYPFECGEKIIAATLGPPGAPTDPSGTRLDVGPDLGNEAVVPASLAFDGNGWVGAYRSQGRVFGARLGTDGSHPDDEPIGLLLDAAEDVRTAELVSTRTAVVVVSRGGVLHRTLTAQRVLAHDPSPGYPAATLGTIGPRATDERQPVRFTVVAPAPLNPATTTMTATGLPVGAVFDAPTRTFQWIPGSDQAGTYVVHFDADDGGSMIGEDVTITVAEAVRSVGGTVTHTGGAPFPYAPLVLSGTRGGKRTIVTDGAGRYRFDDLVPKRYRVQLDKSLRHAYYAATVRADASAGDVRDANVVLLP